MSNNTELSAGNKDKTLTNLLGVFYTDDSQRKQYVESCIEKYREDLKDSEAGFLKAFTMDILEICNREFMDASDTKFHEIKTMNFLYKLCRYANDIWCIFYDSEEDSELYSLYFGIYSHELYNARKLTTFLLKSDYEELINMYFSSDIAALNISSQRTIVLVHKYEKSIKMMIKDLEDAQLKEDVEELENLLFGYSSSVEPEDFTDNFMERLSDKMIFPMDDERIEIDLETIEAYEPKITLSINLNGNKLPDNERAVLSAYIEHRFKDSVAGVALKETLAKPNCQIINYAVPGEYSFNTAEKTAEEIKKCLEEVGKIFTNLAGIVTIDYPPIEDYWDSHGGFINISLNNAHVLYDQVEIE